MKIVSNDRDAIVMRAKEKLRERQKACEALTSKRRKLVKNSKKKAKRLLAAKQKNKTLIGETIDPYLVFDSHGNILVNELMSTTQSLATPVEDTFAQRPSVVSYDTPINYGEYAKQANL